MARVRSQQVSETEVEIREGSGIKGEIGEDPWTENGIGQGSGM